MALRCSALPTLTVVLGRGLLKPGQLGASTQGNFSCGVWAASSGGPPSAILTVVKEVILPTPGLLFFSPRSLPQLGHPGFKRNRSCVVAQCQCSELVTWSHFSYHLLFLLAGGGECCHSALPTPSAQASCVYTEEKSGFIPRPSLPKSLKLEKHWFFVLLQNMAVTKRNTTCYNQVSTGQI